MYGLASSVVWVRGEAGVWKGVVGLMLCGVFLGCLQDGRKRANEGEEGGDCHVGGVWGVECVQYGSSDILQGGAF